MADVATAAVGGLFGFALGGPAGARLGLGLGLVVGNALFPERQPVAEGPRLQDTGITGGAEGTPLPIFWGSVRVTGTVMWQPPTLDEVVTESDAGGGKGGAPSGGGTRNYTYYWSAAIGFAEPGDPNVTPGIRRVWNDTKLVLDQRSDAEIISQTGAVPVGEAERALAVKDRAEDLRLYSGDFDQGVDPVVESYLGAGATQAHIGLVSLAYERLLVTDYGNRRPTVSAELVSGSVTPPPRRIITFDSTIDTSAVEYEDGLFRVAFFDVNAPANGSTTQTIETYTLDGTLVESVTYVGSNIDNQTNVDIAGVPGRVELGHMRRNAAGTGINTGSWWQFRAGGAEGLHVGPPRPFRLNSEFGDQPSGASFDYYHAVGGRIYAHGRIYAENRGLSNRNGIATYPVRKLRAYAPDLLPELFFDMQTAGYVSGAASTARTSMALGDDGLIYVKRASGLEWDNGVDVFVLDEYLQHVRDIELEDSLQGSTRIVVWNNRLVASTPRDIMNDGYMKVYDITPSVMAANSDIAPLIGSAEHAMPFGSGNLHGIGDGLFLADDGIWSLREEVTAEAPTLRSIVESICTRCGVPLSKLDATDLTQTVDGFLIDRPMTGRAAIDVLAKAFNFDAYESQGKLKFKNRGGASVHTFTEDQLGAYIDQPPQSAIVRTREQELEMPTEIAVQFYDVNQDYQRGAVRFQRIEVDREHAITEVLPIVMSSQAAARQCEVMLRTRLYERLLYSWSTDMTYAAHEPADLVVLPTPAGPLLSRITRVTQQANWLLEFEGVADISTLYSSVEVGHTQSNNNSQVVGIKGPTRLELYDGVPLRDVDDDYGFYLTAAGVFSTWSGTFVRREDTGQEPGTVATLLTAAVMGTTTSALVDGATFGRDVTSGLNVRLFADGTVSTITDSQFLAGGNLALVGDELVCFRDVVAESDGTFTLTHLIRGVRGSPRTGHEATERFVMLTTASVRSITGSSADTNVETTFLATSLNVALPSVTRLEATLTNGRLKPNPPVNPVANRHENGDFIGRFIRAARINFAWADFTDVPLDETTEAYEIDVLDGSTVVRTIEVDSSKAFTYTAAEQLVDFGTVQNTVAFDVYQLSDRIGRGWPASFTGTRPDSGLTAYDDAVVALGPIWYVLYDQGFRLTDIVGGTELSLDAGTQGSEWDYTGNSALPGATWPVLEGLGGAWRFDQSLNSVFNLMATEFSVAFILQQSNATSGPWMHLVGRNDAGSPSSSVSVFYIYLETNDRDDIEMGITPAGGSVQYLATVGAGINDGDPHLVVCTWDNAVGGAHEMRIYIDGSSAADVTITASEGTPVNQPSTLLRVGEHNQHGTDVGYEGVIERIGLFDRALSASEVSALFTATGI